MLILESRNFPASIVPKGIWLVIELDLSIMPISHDAEFQNNRTKTLDARERKHFHIHNFITF